MKLNRSKQAGIFTTGGEGSRKGAETQREVGRREILNDDCIITNYEFEITST